MKDKLVSLFSNTIFQVLITDSVCFVAFKGWQFILEFAYI